MWSQNSTGVLIRGVDLETEKKLKNSMRMLLNGRGVSPHSCIHKLAPWDLPNLEIVRKIWHIFPFFSRAYFRISQFTLKKLIIEKEEEKAKYSIYSKQFIFFKIFFSYEWAHTFSYINREEINTFWVYTLSW